MTEPVVYVDCSGGVVQDTPVYFGPVTVVVIDWDVFDDEFADHNTVQEMLEIQEKIDRLPEPKRSSVQKEYDELMAEAKRDHPDLFEGEEDED